jgi:hypothetical protein
VATGNDSVKDNLRPIFAFRPLKALRITGVLGDSIRNGNLNIVAAATIGFRPEFNGGVYTKYFSTVVCDPASAVRHDRVTGAVNLEQRHRERWMEPSRIRDRDRTANRSNRSENVGAMSSQIVTKDCSVRKPRGINPRTIDVVIVLCLRKHRIDKSDIIDALLVRSGSVVHASVVPVAVIGFWKNDQGMVDLAELFKASDFDDRVDPIPGVSVPWKTKTTGTGSGKSEGTNSL